MSPSFTRRTLVGGLAALSFACTALAQEKPAAPPAADAAAAADSVVVFAAASLKNALDTLGKQWTAATGKKVTFSYAASGPLAKQIEAGAPADLFASADLKWMDYVAEKKLIQPESRVSLLGNTLVLVAPAAAKVDLKIAKGFDLAGALGDGKLAVGDPKSVPAGAYAKEALTKLGVWDAVAPKMAFTDNVRSALVFVAREEAKLGIVYATDAKAEPKVRVVDTFPEDSHAPIVYPFALTAGSKNPAAADFLAFVKTSAAAKVFEAEGFTVLH
jgi:molybdate transport system substrate-binding protein